MVKDVSDTLLPLANTNEEPKEKNKGVCKKPKSKTTITTEHRERRLQYKFELNDKTFSSCVVLCFKDNTSFFGVLKYNSELV